MLRTHNGSARTLVDLTEIPHEDRVQTWDASVRDTFGALSVKLADTVPSAGLIRRVRLGAGQLLRIQSAPVEVTYRPTSKVKHHLCMSLMMQLSGSITVSQFGQTCELHEGALCFVDEAKEFRLASEDTTGIVMVRVPRAAALSRYPHIERLCATALCSSDSGTRVLSDTLLRLSHDADYLDELQRSAMLNGLIQMLGVAGTVSAASSATHWRVRRAVKFIENNLSVPGLTAEAVAQDQRISRRRLDQLLHEAFGHSIASQLWSRRLEQAASDLRDGHRSHCSIAQIAFANGFESAAHFARAFKRRFAVTPGQWRLN